jgi:Uma2 family endonuclease
MADPAEKRMTVDEFLQWDDGTDTRYELLDGQIVAMAPPGPAHRIVIGNVARLVGNHLVGRSPCRPELEAGIRISEHRRWQADLAMTCGPLAPDLVDPILIVEVLSSSTRGRDFADKLPDYKSLPSVVEIWLVDSERRWVQVWWREAEDWHGRDHVGGGSFHSTMLDGAVPLDELYLNAGL